MKKLLLTSLFLLPALFGENGSQPYFDEVGTRALAEVNLDWERLLAGWSINFLPGKKGLLGEVFPAQHSIAIYVRQDQSPARVAEIIVHEFAHLVDLTFLTPAQRARWYALRAIPPKTPWYSTPKTTDYSTGAGDFAECMAWTFQGATVKFNSRLGPPPTLHQQQVIRQWLAQINTAGK